MSRPNDIEFSVSAHQFSPCTASFAESTSQPGPLDFLRNTIASTTAAAATTTVGPSGQSALLTASLPPPADWLDWMKNLQASGKLSLPFAASAAALKSPEALLSMVQQRAYQSAYFPPSLPLMLPPAMDLHSSETAADDGDFSMNSLVKNSLLNMHLLAGQLPFWSLPPPPPSPRVPPTTALRAADTAAATAECLADGSPTTTQEEVGFPPKSLPIKCLLDEEKTARLGEVTSVRSAAMAGRCKSTDLSIIRGMDQERSQLLNTLELSSAQLQRGMEECRRYKQSVLPKNPDPSVLKLYQDLRFSVRSCQNVRRKNTTRETTGLLKAWLNDHRKNPYPNKSEKIILAVITKMTLTQVSTWFANARRRLKKENKAISSSCLPSEETDMEEPTDCDNFGHFPQLSADCQSFSQTGSASSPPGLLVEDRLMSGEEEYDKVEVREQQRATPAESTEEVRPTTTEAAQQHWTPRPTNKIWSLVDLAVPQCESDDSTRT